MQVHHLHVDAAPVIAVRESKDLKRILALPRRITGDDAALTAAMTECLKTHEGTQTLRPIQALALHDIGLCRGGLLPVAVGEGKTLISMLAPFVLDSAKPLLLLPATLIDNANRARLALAKHWLVAKHMRVFSYEMLGRESAANELESYAPDVIIADEAHRLKNLGGAACARRVARYMAKHPTTAFVPMSGTLIRDSILDFAHLAFWALKESTPLPFAPAELASWAGALDEAKPGRFGWDEDQSDPGALMQLCTSEELTHVASCSPVFRHSEQVKAARSGFKRRLTETLGVVATAGDRERVDASIRINAVVYPLEDADTERRFSELRNDMLTPDGFELLSGVDVWRHARELALEFHSVWSPRPPAEWLAPRRAWGSFVRAYLARSRTLDSPSQVHQAVLNGSLDDGGILSAWQSVEETFTPNVVEVWHGDSVLRRCAAWAKTPGIVWVDHVFFGEALALLTGLPYYREGGYAADGGYIEQADCTRSIIASIDANRDGKNLQGRASSVEEPEGWKGFSRNLLVGPPDGWDAMQQCIARTHRPGQTADEVIVDILVGCREHVSAWRKIVDGTAAARDTIGGLPKLDLADISFPSDDEISGFSGTRW